MFLTPQKFPQRILPSHLPLSSLAPSWLFISSHFFIVLPPTYTFLNTLFSSYFWNFCESNYTVHFQDLFPFLNSIRFIPVICCISYSLLIPLFEYNNLFCCFTLNICIWVVSDLGILQMVLLWIFCMCVLELFVFFPDFEYAFWKFSQLAQW